MFDTIESRPNSLTRRQEWPIELLRGIAAIMVVAAHYGPIATQELGLLKFAFTGVDLFFVITGYVFAPHLFDNRLAVLEFAIRRMFRIYPLYLVALAMYIGLRAAHGQPVAYVTEHLLFVYTMETREIATYFNPAFWSLPPEVEFYIILPLLGLLIQRGAHLSAVILAAASIAFTLAASRAGDISAVTISYILAFHLPGLLIEFLLGTLAWRLVQRGLRPMMARALLSAGILFWLLLAIIYYEVDVIPITWIAPPVRATAAQLIGVAAAACACAIVAGSVALMHARSGIWKTIGQTSGKLSYGIYLFHNAALAALAPILAAVGTPIYLLCCIVATVTTATVAHFIVEEPARNLGRWLGRRAIA